MVVEADEYDRRFLSYWPEVAVVTSIEPEHLDYYADLAEIRSAFSQLVERLPAHGRLVACADDAFAATLEAPARKETYGFDPSADWRIDDYTPLAGRGARFVLGFPSGRTYKIDSPLVGQHNARNVAAAFAVADYFGVGVRIAAAALPGFKGPRRRFETRGRPRGVWIVDDYGHHPSEVAAVLRSARSIAEGDVWVVFQPHTTHRTASLFEEFTRCFADADHALILPTFRPSGRDQDGPNVGSEQLTDGIRGRDHVDVRYVESFDAATHHITRGARPGDLVLTMGAGDVTQLADRLVEALG
jgi:UDP-N-acetylmuramate--alanine ligase